MQVRLLSRLIHHLGFQQGLAARKRMLFAAVIIQAEWMPLKILGQNPLPCRQDLKHRDQLLDICMEGQVMVIWVYFLHSVSRKKAQLYVIFKKLGHVFISVNLILYVLLHTASVVNRCNTNVWCEKLEPWVMLFYNSQKCYLPRSFNARESPQNF